jgi:hypothetical protein
LLRRRVRNRVTKRGQAGEGAVADIEESFDSIRADLEAVRADAETELSEPIAALENSLDTLSADVDAVRAAGTITREASQGLVDSLAAVSSSWETLKTSAPDCDL